MKTRGRKFAVLALLALRAAFPLHGQDAASAPTPTRESAATIVIYNTADADSATLAAYYAKRRAIPPQHIVGLNCPLTEEITRAQYDETIAEPLRRIFDQRGWWHTPPEPETPVSDNRIRFVALMRGIPLKIANTDDYPGDSFTGDVKQLDTNAAAVDSELAALGMRTRKISGAMRNLYYNSYRPFMDVQLPPFMCVCRLDGPTVANVENMIDGAITAEHRGLLGFAYVDLRGITSGPLAEGDQWLATATVGLRRYGMPVIWDNSPALYPADFPMDHTAIYLGWYAPTVEGPMARDDFHFEPGAIAVHIHSFSGYTVRDSKSNWVGPLIAHGAAATLGNVYEPYLDLTPHLDVFMDRLRLGFNFAESAYASVRALSWMTTFVGDPLYRPFVQLDLTSSENQSKSALEYAAFREGAIAWYAEGRLAGEKQLAASATKLNSGIVWEGLGLLEWSILANDSALEAFRQAEKCYGKTEDGLRTVLHQVAILNAGNKAPEARALATKAIWKYDGFHGTGLLRAVIGTPTPGG